MQSLYAFFSTHEENTQVAEKNMLKHITEILQLYLAVISLLVELINYADVFFEEGKQKHFPKDSDLHPNKRFVENQIIKNIVNNKELIDHVSSMRLLWLNNDHDIISKLFKKIYISDLYQDYITNNDQSLHVDQKFFSNILHEYVLKDKLVHHILEERSIYWIDDLPFVATIIIGSIKSDNNINITNVFKDDSDKIFAIKLFQETISNNNYYEKIIAKFAKNWELARIAIMDQLFLKMAFTEILHMKELPVKVSMNEYIEIAKYYSTEKSKLFVNGILDNAVRNFTLEGKITHDLYK